MRIGLGLHTIRFRGKSADEESRMNRSLSASAPVPWVDWTAQRISDPVVRLRFLRAAAAAGQPKPRRKYSWGRSAGLSLLALVALLGAGRYAVARRGATAV